MAYFLQSRRLQKLMLKNKTKGSNSESLKKVRALNKKKHFRLFGPEPYIRSLNFPFKNLNNQHLYNYLVHARQKNL